ncbi:MAG: hypothetical protein R2688_10895 [Fimbriimonadaceae bacterium]
MAIVCAAMITMSRDDQAKAVKKEIDGTSGKLSVSPIGMMPRPKSTPTLIEKHAFVVDGFKPNNTQRCHLDCFQRPARRSLDYRYELSTRVALPKFMTAENSLQVGLRPELPLAVASADVRLVFKAKLLHD